MVVSEINCDSSFIISECAREDMLLCERVCVSRHEPGRVTDYTNNTLMHILSLSAHFEQEREKTRRQACALYLAIFCF